MAYALHLAVMVGIYALWAVSLDIVAGHLGELSLGHAVFFGIGAYTGALTAQHYHGLLWIILPAAALAGATAGLICGIAFARFRGDEFILATLAVQLIFQNTVVNTEWLTRGPLGIAAIPPPTLIGATPHSEVGIAVVILIICVVFIALVRTATAAPFGSVLRAIRADYLFAESIGKNTRRERSAALVIAGASAAIAGALFALYNSYIEPSMFGLPEAVLVLTMVLIGGGGTTLGTSIGAAVFVLLPEALRFVGISASYAAIIRQLAYGGTLIVLVALRRSSVRNERRILT